MTLRPLLAAVLLTGLGTAALAAPPPGAGPGPAAAKPAHSMAGTIDQRIRDLHTRLQITAVQAPLWEAFTAVMRDNARNTDEGFQRRVQAMPTMTAPENMQSYAAMSAAHAQDAAKLVAPFQALYAAMTDPQKAAADLVFRDQAHRGPHGKRS